MFLFHWPKLFSFFDSFSFPASPSKFNFWNFRKKSVYISAITFVSPTVSE